MPLIKHLEQRGMSDFSYDMVLDFENGIVTFMLYGVADFIINRDNIKPLGYQQYRHLVSEKKTNDPVNSRYFTYQPKCSVINDVVVFGLESLHSLKTKPENLFYY